MKLNLVEYLDRQRDEGFLVLELDEGDPIVIPPALLWPAEVGDKLADLRKGKATLDDLGRALIGDAEFDRWSAAVERMAPGARPGEVLNRAWDEMNRTEQGVSTGE